MKKTSYVIGTIVLILILSSLGGYFLGLTGSIIGALIGAAVGGTMLKKSGAVSANSSLVSETSGVRMAKYVLLAIVLLALAIFAYFVLHQ